MILFIYGGSGSGKSAFAEQKVLELSDDHRYYIATMQVIGEEGKQKVLKHRHMRAKKQFETLECQRDLEQRDWKAEGTYLLECMSNLTANEMFDQQQTYEESYVVEKVFSGVSKLCAEAKNVIIVGNTVSEDGIEYDEMTKSYQRALGEVQRKISSLADEVYEIVVGIPIKQKG